MTPKALTTPISDLINALLLHTTLWQQGELATIVVPDTDHGRPTFWHTSDGVVVEALCGGREVWLTLLPDLKVAECNEIAARIPLTRSLEVLSDAQLFPAALSYNDSNGVLHTCAVMLQERFVPLDCFVRHNISARHQQRLRNALHSIAINIVTFLDGTLTHGRLARGVVGFTPEGSLRLADYPLAHRATNPRGDCCSLARCALLIFVAACSKRAYNLLTGGTLAHVERSKIYEYIVAAAQYYGADGVVVAASVCAQEDSDVESYCMAIAGLSREPFRPLPLLENLLAQAAQLGANHCLVPVEEVHRLVVPDRIDLKTCEFVGAPADTYIRFCKSGLWGFASHRGDIIHIDRPLTYATDFYEGLAVVRTESGFGVVNTLGEWVMADRWADIVWHGEENVIAATEDGTTWHLYNRMGHQISYYATQGFGTPSEGYIVAQHNGKFGYYTTDGVKRTDFIYEQAGSFHNGYALVRYNGNTYHINTTFPRITSLQELLLAEGKL